MTDELTHLDLDEPIEVRSPEERRITIRMVPWGEIARTREGTREVFVPGAFLGVDPTDVTIESTRHGGPLVGRGESIDEREDGAYLDAIISQTPAGDELLELARSRVLKRASIVFAALPGGTRRRPDGVIERHIVDLRRVAVLERGAYKGAAVMAVRAAEEEAEMTQETVTGLTLDQAVERIEGVILQRMEAPPQLIVPAPVAEASPLAAIGSFSELYERVLAGDTELARVWADAITTDTPPLVRPAWLETIVGIMTQSRSTVGAFGQLGLPATGMEVDWPVFDGDLTDRVAAQATEKTEVISKKLVIDSDKALVKTYAGGADVSWQLLRRSSPSFRDAFLRVLSAAWAVTTDQAFGAAIEAHADLGEVDYVIGSDTDGAKFAAALIDASVMVEDATGMPASFCIAGSTAWKTIAKFSKLMPPMYGTVNIPGVANARTLAVEVQGIPVLRGKGLALTTVLVSNGETAKWHEDGPFTAEQDVVSKLGTDTVIWSLGAPAIYVPAGIVSLYDVTP